jgi:hypothetical protein
MEIRTDAVQTTESQYPTNRGAGVGVLARMWRTKQNSAGIQDYKSTLELRGEINRHTGYDEDCNTGIYPDKCLVIDGLSGGKAATRFLSTADAALPKETIIVALKKMCLHLAHGIEHHANDDQESSAAKELRSHVRNIQALAKKLWQNSHCG